MTIYQCLWSNYNGCGRKHPVSPTRQNQNKLFVYFKHYIFHGIYCSVEGFLAVLNATVASSLAQHFIYDCVGNNISEITSLTVPTWGPARADRSQVGPKVAPWSLLSGMLSKTITLSILHLHASRHSIFAIVVDELVTTKSGHPCIHDVLLYTIYTSSSLQLLIHALFPCMELYNCHIST